MDVIRKNVKGVPIEVSITDGGDACYHLCFQGNASKDDVEEPMRNMQLAEDLAQKYGKDFRIDNFEFMKELAKQPLQAQLDVFCLLGHKTMNEIGPWNPVLNDYLRVSLNESCECNVNDESSMVQTTYDFAELFRKIDNHLKIGQLLGLSMMGVGVYDAMSGGYDGEYEINCVLAARKFMEFYEKNPYPGNEGLSAFEKKAFSDKYETKIVELMRHYDISHFWPEDEDDDPEELASEYIIYDIIHLVYTRADGKALNYLL